MTVQAQLADGRILEFPDGTDPAVIQNTVKSMLSQQSAPQSQQDKLLLAQDLLARQAKGEQGLQEQITQLRGEVGQPDTGELAVKPAGILETLTGSERIKLRPELGELPEFGATEEGDTFKIAAGLLATSNPQEQQDIIKSAIPEAQFETFNDGTTVIEVPDGQGGTRRSVLNRPGGSFQDAQTLIAQALAFVPAARLATLGKGLAAKIGIGAAGSAATEQARQELVIAEGSEQGRDPTSTAIAGAFGAGAEAVAPFAGRIRDFLRASPDPEAAAILKAGERANVPLLTSDVLPPETFFGKGVQSLGEKIGFLGTGPLRAKQQKAREQVVQSLAEDFDITSVNDDFFPKIIDSLSSKQAKGLEQAAIKRSNVINKLSDLGDVPTTNAIREIDKQIARQTGLRAKANQTIINNLEETKSSIVNGDFQHVADIRSSVIKDLQQAGRGEDVARSAPVLQAVKSAIDKDMVIFARQSQKPLNDKTIVKDWLSSNREFAFELGKGKDAVLKRLLQSGDAKPSLISPALRSGDLTQLKKLKSGLTEKGVMNARSAIIKDVLESSKFFSSENPDLLVNALKKPKIQRSINVFFNDTQKKQLDGLTRLLDSTRQAQKAAVSTPTGQQLIPVVTTGAAVADPLTTFLTAGTLAAVTRGYESKAVRTILLKLAASKKGSPAESAILRQLQPVIQSARLSIQEEGNQQ